MTGLTSTASPNIHCLVAFLHQQENHQEIFTTKVYCSGALQCAQSANDESQQAKKLP
jgi:hypothetical protein